MKDYPYWVDTLRPSDAEILQNKLPERANLVVVGAGYTGLSAARTAARAGMSVLVVDRDSIGGGASSRNGGQVLTGLRPNPAALVNTYGASEARRLFDAASVAIHHLADLIASESIECGFRKPGHIQAAWKPAHFESFREEQSLLRRVFAHEVHLVDRREQRSELGSTCYHGLLVDEASAAVNPVQLVHGLARAARRAGACIVSHAAVERLERTGHAWRVHTSRGVVQSAHLMIATNGYTGDATPALRRRLVPIGSFIIVTEPIDQSLADAVLPKRRMAFDSKHFLYYFRLLDDRRVLFGGRAQFTAPTAESTRRAAEILRRGMLTVFPDLEGVGIDYAWSGNVAFTRDQLPHGGEIDNMHFAAGYCGHGIALATELGQLVARRIIDGNSAASRHPLLDRELPAIPLYRGNPWFLPLAGAYYQVKDWLT